MELTALTAREARALIDAGEVSAVDLVTAHLTRIDELDQTLNSFVTVDPDAALATARDLDAAHARGVSKGALHGLPVAIKDLQSTAGLRTTYGSPAFADHVPTTDAGIVARIRAAGGVVLGKTNIPERSIGANTVNPVVGATGNPFDPQLTCGGSSGGSAAALAAGLAPLATGSDHGGSIRIPASFCGVVGHRATPGVVPNEERTMTQNFYSVQGPMARTVDDVALLLSVVADREHVARPHDPMMFPLDARSFARLDDVDAGALRIAISPDLGGVLVSDHVRRVFRERMGRLARHVEVREHPVDLTDAPDVDWHVRSDIFVTQYHREAETWDDDFNPNIRQSYEAALTMSMYDIAVARRRQTELHRTFQAIFDDFDVLICPGVSISPFPWSQRNPNQIDGQPVDNYMAWLALSSSLTVVGHPVTALPCGVDEHDMPFGLQVVGPSHHDHRLLSIARTLESIFDDDPSTRRPVPDPAVITASDAGCRDARM